MRRGVHGAAHWTAGTSNSRPMPVRKPAVGGHGRIPCPPQFSFRVLDRIACSEFRWALKRGMKTLLAQPPGQDVKSLLGAGCAAPD
jgi:hypothetical protein